MPGPPQVEQRLEGVPALGLPRTLTSCAGPTCLGLGPEGGLSTGAGRRVWSIVEGAGWSY